MREEKGIGREEQEKKTALICIRKNKIMYASKPVRMYLSILRVVCVCTEGFARLPVAPRDVTLGREIRRRPLHQKSSMLSRAGVEPRASKQEFPAQTRAFPLALSSSCRKSLYSSNGKPEVTDWFILRVGGRMCVCLS